MMRLLIFRNDAPTRRRGDAPTTKVLKLLRSSF